MKIDSGKDKIITSNHQVDKSSVKKQDDPEDIVVVSPSYLPGENQGFISFPQEKIETAKKIMDEAGFEFDEHGMASAIIYSSGENKLCDAEKVVTVYGGKVTGSLWLIDAFTAELTPQAFCYLYELMPGYRPVPDMEYNKLIKPPCAGKNKSNINPTKALLDMSKLLGLE